MTAIRFIMLGGFLGAGKTTLLARLARHYQNQGLKVGIITNDQAENLVDTQNFKSQGLATEEIPGGCFCCKFSALAEAAKKLTHINRPDLLLAEPVGSCTDLIATVVQPLKRIYAGSYRVAPYVVLVDPVRVRSILTEEHFGGFSAKVVYIFHKQLEEADVIAINKVDSLTPVQRHVVARLLKKHYPDKEILSVSARTGEGVDSLLKRIEANGGVGRHIAEVDYDTYAEGEAELGWLNSTLRLTAPEEFAADQFLLELAKSMQEMFTRQDAEVAHLKLLLQAGDTIAVANLARGDSVPELSRPSQMTVQAADLIINARVHATPETLRQIADQCLSAICRDRGIEISQQRTQCFKPGRPVPTYRYADAV